MNDIFYEIFRDLPRQGPGNDRYTKIAFDLLDIHEEELNILDVGCGTGKQTFALAQVTKGTITAIDNHPHFVNEVNRKASELGLTHRVKAIEANMFEMPFDREQFDLIWSEGALYIMGFENAIKQMRKYIRPEGYLVASELCWTTLKRPREINSYWNDSYQEIGIMQDVLKKIRRANYEPVGSFKLPDHAWWADFYTPMLSKLKEMRHQYQSQPQALEIVTAEEFEIKLHQMYSRYYGYIFFLMRKA